MATPVGKTWTEGVDLFNDQGNGKLYMSPSPRTIFGARTNFRLVGSRPTILTTSVNLDIVIGNGSLGITGSPPIFTYDWTREAGNTTINITGYEPTPVIA